MELLKKGSKGDSVKLLQELLNKHGFNLTVDGDFGNKTETAVKQLQTRLNLTVDGIVGSKTFDALQAKYGYKFEVSDDIDKLLKTRQTKRKINLIVLHCYATKEGQNFTVDDVNRWHIARGFKKIGYHYVIDLDGTIHKGRDESEIGAHAEGYNSNSVGISYCGGCDKNGKAKDTRTKAQIESQCRIVYELLNKYNLTLNNVKCHYQLCKNGKQCPSHTIEQFKKDFKQYVRDKYNREFN